MFVSSVVGASGTVLLSLDDLLPPVVELSVPPPFDDEPLLSLDELEPPLSDEELPPLSLDELDFLMESNAIENEFSQIAFEDSVKAWSYLKTQKKLTLDVLLDTHKKLLCRLHPDIAGSFRTCDVWIGGKKKAYLFKTVFEEKIQKIFE